MATPYNFHAPDVVCAVLPFCQLSPALDASTLATILRQQGIRAKVIYLNRLFASKIDSSFYETTAATVSLNSLLADWVFRDHVFGVMDDRNYLKSLLDRTYARADLIAPAIHAKAAVEPFLDACLTAVDWNTVKVLCLVETFAKRDAVAGQLMASMALAKKVKHAFPHIRIVIAGPSTEREMGEAIAHLPFLDVVCTGDLYATAPTRIQQLLEAKAPAPRANAAPSPYPRQHASRSKRVVLDLPVPDFDDYFALRGDGLPGCFDSIPMETSKGCWWAERCHCSFCALPGSNVAYRSKSAEVALQEFLLQAERYKPRRIEMNDLIIDQSYFAELFPRLGSFSLGVDIFYETKAHLRRDQLEVMHASGIRSIQAGIETMSARSLQSMDKGVSVARNLKFLKDCADLGIKCYWNYLHSFPGETAVDLLGAIPVIDAAHALPPPATFQPVRVERFSPYFRDPEAYGLRDVRPDRSYSMVYGDTGIDLNRFAFYFEHHEQGVNEIERGIAVARVKSAVQRWQSSFAKQGSL